MQKPPISREVWFQLRDAIYEALQDRDGEFTQDQGDVEAVQRIVHEAMLPWWTPEEVEDAVSASQT